jgi:tetratricopeptide (TPR) repeat protein
MCAAHRVRRMADRLRPLWDFDDLDASEQRFHLQLEQETTDAGRAEVLMQLARVEGLRGNFEACAGLLDEAEPLAGTDARANVRLELERGRMFRSSGDPEAAFPLFKDAFIRAVEADERYLAGDGAHMCAISVDDRALQEEWTQRGLDEGDPYWAGPLYNNLGWAYFDAGDHERALELFELALEARERDQDNGEALAFAKYCVGVARRALGRPEEAVPMLEAAVAWTRDAGKPDAEYERELAEARAAQGKTAR